MDPVDTLRRVLKSVSRHCANVKALKPECRVLGRLVEDVSPLFSTYCDELEKSGGDGSNRSWAQTLHTALSEALGAVNECTYNPMKAKCFPGKYLKKIKAGGQAIRDAMQTLSVSHAAVSAQAKNELDDVLDEVLSLEEKIDRSSTKLEAKADEVRGALPRRKVSASPTPLPLTPSLSHAPSPSPLSLQLRKEVKAAIQAQNAELIAALADREGVSHEAIAEQAELLASMAQKLDAVLASNSALRSEVQEAIAAGNQKVLDAIAEKHDVYGGGAALESQFAESLARVEAAVLENGSKLDILMGRKTAHDTKNVRMEQLEVVLDSIEPKPFAAGGFGVVYRGSYQGETVAVKKVPLDGVPMKQREKLVADFKKELVSRAVAAAVAPLPPLSTTPPAPPRPATH